MSKIIEKNTKLKLNSAIADATSNQRGVILSMMMFLLLTFGATNTVQSHSVNTDWNHIPPTVRTEMQTILQTTLDTLVIETVAGVTYSDPKSDGTFSTSYLDPNGVTIFRIHDATGSVLYMEYQFPGGTKVPHPPIPPGRLPPAGWLIDPNGTLINIWQEADVITAQALSYFIPVEELYDTVITITSTCLQHQFDFPVKIHYIDISNTYDLSDLFTTVTVFPNPSDLYADVNVSIMPKQGQNPLSVNIYGRLDIYHLRNGEIVYVGSVPELKIGETYTICRKLLSNPGTYNVVGKFYYLENSFETNSLIIRR